MISVWAIHNLPLAVGNAGVCERQEMENRGMCPSQMSRSAVTPFLEEKHRKDKESSHPRCANTLFVGFNTVYGQASVTLPTSRFEDEGLLPPRPYALNPPCPLSRP